MKRGSFAAGGILAGSMLVLFFAVYQHSTLIYNSVSITNFFILYFIEILIAVKFMAPLKYLLNPYKASHEHVGSMAFILNFSVLVLITNLIIEVNFIRYKSEWVEGVATSVRQVKMGSPVFLVKVSIPPARGRSSGYCYFRYDTRKVESQIYQDQLIKLKIKKGLLGLRRAEPEAAMSFLKGNAFEK